GRARRTVAAGAHSGGRHRGSRERGARPRASGRGVILSRPMALVLPVVFAFVGRGPRCPPAAAPRPERRPPRAHEEKAPTAVPSRLFAKTKIPATSYSPT